MSGRKVPASSRTALSMIELLVVIAIIIVLLAILLSAIQKVRETANRIVCASNLRQLAVACTNYDTQVGHLPTGQYGDYNRPNAFGGAYENSSSWSWIAYSLPYFEQDEVSAAGNIPTAALDQSSATGAQIKLLLCPSDVLANLGPQVELSHYFRAPGLLAGMTNYKGVEGANYCFGPYFNDGVNGPGIGGEPPTYCECWEDGDGTFFPMVWEKPISISGILDGASNTFIIGEDIYLPSTVGPSYFGRGYAWAHATTATMTCAIPPNLVRPTSPPDDLANWQITNGFKSRHMGGVQFACADGSVHFIANNISLKLYRALATIRGGESAEVP